jgi:hypothetical protein
MRHLVSSAILTIVAFIAFGSASSAVELTVGSMATNRVLFLGNSLTYHPVNTDIGWYGDWGMASTSADKDYAHLVVSRIAGLNGGVSPEMKAVNVYQYGQYEQNYRNFNVATNMASLLAWNPDVLVVELGENVETLTTAEKQQDFAASFLNLLTTFKDKSHPTIFVRNTWWPDATKDAIMKHATEEVGGVWVDLGNLTLNPLNVATSMGIYTNEAVAAHPSNQGMQVMADGIFAAMKTHGVPEPNTLASLTIASLFFSGMAAAKSGCRCRKQREGWAG